MESTMLSQVIEGKPEYVYIVNPSRANFLKIGRWRGHISKLKTRYVTPYGDFELTTFQCADSTVMEKEVFQHLAQYRWKGELFEKDSLEAVMTFLADHCDLSCKSLDLEETIYRLGVTREAQRKIEEFKQRHGQKPICNVSQLRQKIQEEKREKKLDKLVDLLVETTLKEVVAELTAEYREENREHVVSIWIDQHIQRSDNSFITRKQILERLETIAEQYKLTDKFIDEQLYAKLGKPKEQVKFTNAEGLQRHRSVYMNYKFVE